MAYLNNLQANEYLEHHDMQIQNLIIRCIRLQAIIAVITDYHVCKLPLYSETVISLNTNPIVLAAFERKHTYYEGSVCV